MKKTITAIIFVSLVISATLMFTSCQEKVVVDGKYAKLAQCLTEKGVKFYGAYWCGHCQSQKKAFGDDMRYVNYVECDPNGKDSKTQECIDAGVNSYPSWFFPGQGLEVGVMGMETLAQKANCQDTLAIAESSGESEATPVQPDQTTPAETIPNSMPANLGAPVETAEPVTAGVGETPST